MFTENPFEPKDKKGKLSSLLNTLTILSIIANILGLISPIFAFINAKSNYERMEEMMSSKKFASSPGYIKFFFNEENLSMSKKMYENRIPLLIICLISALLCLYGAIEMRKLKKQGFQLWLIGELLIHIGSLLFVGVSSLLGFNLISLLFSGIFIFLYNKSRKELIY